MKTAVFGHDETCDDTTLSLNSGAIPPLTFAPPASLSVSSSLQIRGGSVVNAVSSYRSHHPRRTSRMQNVSVCSFTNYQALSLMLSFPSFFSFDQILLLISWMLWKSDRSKQCITFIYYYFFETSIPTSLFSI